MAPGIKDQTASRIVYEPLASFDIEGKLVPFLAAEIPSLENGQVASDGRSVTWKLKRDVKWSDGVPFTAKDVLFTYAYITNEDVGSSSAGSYKSVEKVEALDDLTVKVTFKNVNPAWSLPFVGVQGMIIPEHVFARIQQQGCRQRSGQSGADRNRTLPSQGIPHGGCPSYRRRRRQHGQDHIRAKSRISRS